MLQMGPWGRRPVCGAALLCWVADALGQSCSYGPLARGGDGQLWVAALAVALARDGLWLWLAGALRQSRLTVLDCWRLREDLSWKVLRGSGEGCKKNSIALEGRGGWLFDACGTANSVTTMAMASSAILVRCVARSDWKGGSQAEN